MLSIVVPIYNEGGWCITLCHSILDAVKSMGMEVEVVLVDDGSTG
jgi:glycosyltransferase involved in cell wall biosynthesis